MANSAPNPADNSGVSDQSAQTGFSLLTDDSVNAPVDQPAGRRKEVLNSPLPGESSVSETSTDETLGSETSVDETSINETLINNALTNENSATSETAPSNGHLENLTPTDTAPPEQTADQPTEYESGQAELEPTIEKLQQEIEQNKQKAPKKVAVRQENGDQVVPKTVAQPVVILPLTEEKMDAARKKNPTYSIKWLYTWAKRQIKKFKDILVVYRDKPTDRK